jgi:bifunctional DNA-binding transcriptional regulator/antitoxin component of YhaV-PrlF toxin-antitoxin module
MTPKVKDNAGLRRRRRNGHSTVSAKNQVTLPVAALAAAGLKAGDEVRIEADGPGRLTLVREEDPWDKWAGFLAGVYEPGYLEKLRQDWER